MTEPVSTPKLKPKSPRLHGGYKGSVGAFCCVPGCTNSRGRCNRKGLNLSFYKFPTNKKRSDLWLNHIRRGEVDKGRVVPFVPKKHHTVCSQHFEGGWFT